MEGSRVHIIDQRLLPHRQVVLELSTYQETTDAIRHMAVRGAGTIGVAAGFAMTQAAMSGSAENFFKELEQAASFINAARPTAKNLSYAVDRVLAAARREKSVEAARQKAIEEAQAIYEDDARMTHAIAQAGLSLLPKGKAVMTHCNAGWLAYPGWGTALAPIYLAHEQGQSVFVYATETRPRSQGAKLTAWELAQGGVPHALIADTAAGYTIAKGEIGLIIVGADRIAANGDTANKIGTYTLSVLAKEHGVPFYVAAPSPTFDPECPDGTHIPIEERDEKEVLEVSGSGADGEELRVRVATPGVQVKNPAFDVTPASNIRGFITERGIIEPSRQAIAQFLGSARQRVEG
jgi:S-methyl-5-thioribose-1-phosphate isomerase